MPERPPNAPAPDHSLLMAARYNDAETEDHTLSEALAHHELKIEEVEYVAEQRALRIVLMQRPGGFQFDPTQPVPVELSDAEQNMLDALVPLYIDGIFLGWRAREFEDSRV